MNNKKIFLIILLLILIKTSLANVNCPVNGFLVGTNHTHILLKSYDLTVTILDTGDDCSVNIFNQTKTGCIKDGIINCTFTSLPVLQNKPYKTCFYLNKTLWQKSDTTWCGDKEHNNLSSLQGGKVGEYYHTNQSYYNLLTSYIHKWVINDQNNYTTGLTVTNTSTHVGTMTILGRTNIVFSWIDKAYERMLNATVHAMVNQKVLNSTFETRMTQKMNNDTTHAMVNVKLNNQTFNAKIGALTNGKFCMANGTALICNETRVVDTAYTRVLNSTFESRMIQKMNNDTTHTMIGAKLLNITFTNFLLKAVTQNSYLINNSNISVHNVTDLNKTIQSFGYITSYNASGVKTLRENSTYLSLNDSKNNIMIGLNDLKLDTYISSKFSNTTAETRLSKKVSNRTVGDLTNGKFCMANGTALICNETRVVDTDTNHNLTNELFMNGLNITSGNLNVSKNITANILFGKYAAINNLYVQNLNPYMADYILVDKDIKINGNLYVRDTLQSDGLLQTNSSLIPIIPYQKLGNVTHQWGHIYGVNVTGTTVYGANGTFSDTVRTDILKAAGNYVEVDASLLYLNDYNVSIGKQSSTVAGFYASTPYVTYHGLGYGSGADGGVARICHHGFNNNGTAATCITAFSLFASNDVTSIVNTIPPETRNFSICLYTSPLGGRFVLINDWEADATQCQKDVIAIVGVTPTVNYTQKNVWVKDTPTSNFINGNWNANMSANVAPFPPDLNYSTEISSTDTATLDYVIYDGSEINFVDDSDNSILELTNETVTLSGNFRVTNDLIEDNSNIPAVGIESTTGIFYDLANNTYLGKPAAFGAGSKCGNITLTYDDAGNVGFAYGTEHPSFNISLNTKFTEDILGKNATFTDNITVNNGDKVCTSKNGYCNQTISPDQNNYTTKVWVNGTTTKNLTMTRNGMSQLSVNFTDIDTNTNHNNTQNLSMPTGMIKVEKLVGGNVSGYTNPTWQSGINISGNKNIFELINKNTFLALGVYGNTAYVDTKNTNNLIIGYMGKIDGTNSGSWITINKSSMSISRSIITNTSIKAKTINSTSSIKSNNVTAITNLTLGTTTINSFSQLNKTGYFWNLTANTYDGSWLGGVEEGYRAGNHICNTNYTGSHLCSGEELGNTLRDKNVSLIKSWTGNAWYATNTGAKYAPASIPFSDCNGFQDGTVSYGGNYFKFNSNASAAILCNNALKIACCKNW